MLVKNIETFKKYVAINFGLDIKVIEPYIRKKERKHIKSVIGSTLYDTWTTTPPTEGVALEVYTLLQEASAHLAAFAYTFIGHVQISSAGINISQGTNTAAAEWWRIRDLRKDLLKSGHEAIDEALEIMEANEADFEGWPSSEGYTNFKKFFIRKTQTFQEYFNIDNSRLVFLRLRPHLLKVEQKYFKGLLGTETVDKIKAAADEPAQEALRLCQAAQAALTISELAYEGAFNLTPEGLLIEIEEIPGDKKQVVEEKLVYKLHQVKLTQGNELLKELLLHLEDYPDTFTEYAAKEANVTVTTAHNTTSIVSF